MTRQDLFDQIRAKESFLCIGLDPDWEKIPSHLKKMPDPVFEFNKQIIDATHDLCVAYKPNLAFYEALGSKGWETLEKTIRYIPEGHFVIADAKRGDIGNTSALYARAFFDQLPCDAVTVAPYMGEDSVRPFLGRKGKWVVLLALTSNPGSSDFQLLPQAGGMPLYEQVMRRAMDWAGPDEMMFVVGATHPEKLSELRKFSSEYFFLVPGVGAQGGDLEAVCRHGMTAGGGLLVNASRSILYAGGGETFGTDAREEAGRLQGEMARLLKKFGNGR